MGKSNLPIWMEDLSGNSSDKTSLHATVTKWKASIQILKMRQKKMMLVVDAAFSLQTFTNQIKKAGNMPAFLDLMVN
jgi:transposase